MLHIRAPRPGDAQSLAAVVRQADRDEVVGITGLPVSVVLDQAFAGPGDSFIAAEGDRPLIAFGVVPVLPGTGAAWLVGADLTKSQAVQVLTEGPAVLDRLQARWPLLINVVDQRNATHVRWLRRHGFQLHTDQPVYGAIGVPVTSFYRTANV